jgi:hypothetical protein
MKNTFKLEKLAKWLLNKEHFTLPMLLLLLFFLLSVAANKLPVTLTQVDGYSFIKWTESDSGTLTAPGYWNHDYVLHELDLREFTDGGKLIIDIVIGNGESDASIDLFGENQEIPTEGHPVSLAGAYDIPAGSSTQIIYYFNEGEIFKLGFEGNWFSPQGSTNTYSFVASATATIVSWTESDSGTLTAPGYWNHDYVLHELDLREFTDGGKLIIDIVIGNGESDASIDLFGENQEIPTEGHPVSLAGAYDIPAGSSTQIIYYFNEGEIFKLGFEGNWFSPQGSTNTYYYNAKVLVEEYQPDTGSIQIFIEPQAAIDAGAQWRLTTGPDTGWKNSGDIISNLPPGTYIVTFKEISGLSGPAEIGLSLEEGENISIEGS